MEIRLQVVASVLCGLSLLAAGCSGGSEVSSVSGEAASPQVFDTAAPPTEGDVDAGDGNDGDAGGVTEPEVVSVALPSLPVGGSEGLTSDTPQCVSVAWNDLGEIPDGLVFALTGASFDPAGSFAVADESCAEPCLDSGFQPTSNSSCQIPVVWTGGDDTSAAMTVVATATCPPEQSEACQAFADGQSAGSFQLTGIPAEESDTTDPGDTTGNGDG